VGSELGGTRWRVSCQSPSITGIIPTLSLYTHIYIASLFYSYSINSVLHSSSPTIRDSYEPGFAYRIAKLLKFTHTTAIALASLYRSLTQNILRLLRIHRIRRHYCNLAILIISTHFLGIKLAIKLSPNCYLIWHLRPRDPPGLSSS